MSDTQNKAQTSAENPDWACVADQLDSLLKLRSIPFGPERPVVSGLEVELGGGAIGGQLRIDGAVRWPVNRAGNRNRGDQSQTAKPAPATRTTGRRARVFGRPWSTVLFFRISQASSSSA